MIKLLRILFVICLFSPSLLAQNDEEMQILMTEEGEKKVICDGYGPDAEVALQNALRNAVEQAVGSYVSSETQIENDELIKDEVLSLSHGFIKEYRKLSESQFDEEVKVVVAAIIVEKQVIESLEASGIKVNYNTKGLLQDLMEWDRMKDDELKMAKALFDVPKLKDYGIVWDYFLKVDEPKRSGDRFTVGGTVFAKTNYNYSGEFYNLKNILSELALETEEMKYQMPAPYQSYPGSNQTIDYQRFAYKVIKRKNNGKIKEATRFVDLIVPIVEPQMMKKGQAYGYRNQVKLGFFGLNNVTGLIGQAVYKKYEKPLTTQDKNRINDPWLEQHNIVFDFFEKDFSPYVFLLTEGTNVLTYSKVLTFYKFMHPETLEVIRNYITFLFEAAHCKVIFHTEEGDIDFIPDAFYAQYAGIRPEVWSTNARGAYKGYIFNKVPNLSFTFKVEETFTEEEFSKITDISVKPFKGEQWMKNP